MSLGKKILATGVVVILLLAVLGVVGVVFVVPSVAQSLVRERLDRVQQRLSLEVTTGAIETIGIGGVEITDLAVRDPESGRTIVTVKRVGATVSVPRLLMGEKIVTSLWSEDVDVTLTREEDGGIDLVRFARRARSANPEDTEAVTEEPTESGGILRYFGGTLPEMDVTDVQVSFAAVEGVEPMPILALNVPTLEIVHADGIEVATRVTVESLPESEWSLPGEVEVAMVLSDELKPTALNVKFDRAVEVSGLGPAPFLRAGFAGVELSPEGMVTITDAHIGFASTEKSFLETKRVSLSIAEFALDPREIVFGNLTVDSPRVSLVYDEQGASELTDLDHALRAPRARGVVAQARRFAADVEEQRKRAAAKEPEDEDAVDEAQPEEEVAADEPEPEGPSKLERLLAKLPMTIAVKDAVVTVVDDRQLPVVKRAHKLRLEGGNLQIGHRVEEADFRVEGGFNAIADEQPRGSVKGLVAFGYREKRLDADVEIDSLDLSWLGQMLGPTVAENVRGGTLRAKLDVKPAKGRAVTLSGNASVENLVYFWDLLAEEPVEEFTASYGFSATYDPDGKIPTPRLLKKGLYKESNTPKPGDSIESGSLVFTKGAAQMGQAKASVLPAIYGTGGLPGRMPALVTLSVDLPNTPAQTLFDAVPIAIQGPLQGTEMAGNFAWKLDLEVPLYRAGDMEWVSNPVLEEFELVSIPKEVDPNKLMTGFKLTIETTLEDKKGEEFEWSRTIRIPAAQPVSAKYLIENAGLTIEDLDARRREREWPPVPDPKKSWLPKITLESPEYWLTSSAENQTAKLPWTPGDAIERSEEEPYGPYVFVPLQHISKWAVRTVTTTEDGGFFRHPGFLFDSLKESVEDNIEASRFRRGGSTISMQLVKNAFLDQKKLLARKIREAFIVWLMESVVDVPKSRILEVYLNIIEFGPGIYGMHDAAVHYFGKRPNELEVDEVAWLFSILPAPKKYHFYWDKGEITDRWFAKMKRYLDAMVRRDKLTKEERDEAAAEPPEFYKPDVLQDEPVLRPKEDLFQISPFMLDETPPSDGTTPAFLPVTPTQKTPPSTRKPLPTPPPKKKKKGWFFGR